MSRMTRVVSRSENYLLRLVFAAGIAIFFA